jgi:FAD:protein FMN transferase
MHVKRLSRRQALQTGLAGALAVGTSPLSAANTPHATNAHPADFSFHRDHVIGTSFEAWLEASTLEEAEHAEQAMLDEVERLRLVFSTFDPASEISWLNRVTGPVAVSADMTAVLHEYESWRVRTHGALSGQVGGLVNVWTEAQTAGKAPTKGRLAQLAEQTCQPGWEIDEANRTVRRLTDQPLNLNSVAKGFIIQKAVAAAITTAPSLRSVLLNIGGDMLGWVNGQNSRPGWLIAVQDPFHPAENAPPLTALRLANAAVATSGGYLRHYTIGAHQHAHLLDPRTGRPALGIASATVLAQTSVVANALATSLCVLSIPEGLRLIAELPGVECLLVGADGRLWRSEGFHLHEAAVAAADEKPAAKAANPWPDDFEVSINIELPKINATRYRRPYVAVWIENAAGKSVRSITVWGNSPRYWPALPAWWKFTKDDKDLVKTVTRATREPGKYEVVWDGKDDQGSPLPRATYTVRVEVHREHGKDLIQTGKIACGANPAKITLAKNDETGATTIVYGKKK